MYSSVGLRSLTISLPSTLRTSELLQQKLS
jgi:hypothetical protein